MRYALAFLLLASCLPTKTEQVTCKTDKVCGAGFRCDLSRNLCICDGTSTFPGCASYIPDSSVATEVRPLDATEDLLSDDAQTKDNAGIDVPGVDGSNVDASSPDQATPDMKDALGSCSQDSECKDPTKSFCVANACVGCQGAVPSACSTRSALMPVCSAAGACVGCTFNTDCKEPGKSFCVANACTGCTAVPADACALIYPATPVCVSSGVGAGTCVECSGDANCTKDPAKSFCASNTCVGCQGAATFACSTRAATKPVCIASGVGAGTCVECSADADCKVPSKSFCNLTKNECMACQGVGGSTMCATKSPTKPVCAATGTAIGQCVQCTDDTTCTGTTPVCATSLNTCRGCNADTECTGTGPGVCMFHQDKRCATDAETQVVTTGGTMPTIASLATKDLVVVRGTVVGSTAWVLTGSQLSVVGQSSAQLAGPGASGPTLHVTGGDLYIRGVTVSSGSPGIQADGGGVLRLERVSISSNTAGGILIDGSGFDIKNTTVGLNGPNLVDVGWGGIRIQNVPTSSSIPKNLALTTVTTNQQIGVSCSAGTTLSPLPTSVLSSGNTGGEINGSCGFTSCSPASSTCGAQP